MTCLLSDLYFVCPIGNLFVRGLIVPRVMKGHHRLFVLIKHFLTTKEPSKPSVFDRATLEIVGLFNRIISPATGTKCLNEWTRHQRRIHISIDRCLSANCTTHHTNRTVPSTSFTYLSQFDDNLIFHFFTDTNLSWLPPSFPTDNRFLQFCQATKSLSPSPSLIITTTTNKQKDIICTIDIH